MDIFGLVCGFFYLWQKLFAFAYGSDEELGKKSLKKCKIEQALRMMPFAFVQIDQIGDRLKAIKRDPDGKDNFDNGNMGGNPQEVDDLKERNPKEREVLMNSQDSQLTGDPQK